MFVKSGDGGGVERGESEKTMCVQMLDNKKKKNRYTLIKTIKSIKRFYHSLV